MPPTLTPFLNTLRYTPLLSFSPLRTLFNSAPPSPQAPSVNRYLLRPPFAGAVRECPTPIILVRALGLSSSYPSLATASSTDEDADTDWSDWGGMFAEKGYTALEVDISAPSSPSPPGEGQVSPLKAMSTLLASQIRLLAIPFPPILVSSGDSCLLTQIYVEDNPASGLVMLDPPAPSSSGLSSGSAGSGIPSVVGKVGDMVQGKGKEGETSWELPIFGYEPAFPILVLSSSSRSAEISQSRLGQAASKGRGRGGKGVQLENMVDGPRGEKNRIVRRLGFTFVPLGLMLC